VLSAWLQGAAKVAEIPLTFHINIPWCTSDPQRVVCQVSRHSWRQKGPRTSLTVYRAPPLPATWTDNNRLHPRGGATATPQRGVLHRTVSSMETTGSCMSTAGGGDCHPQRGVLHRTLSSMETILSCMSTVGGGDCHPSEGSLGLDGVIDGDDRGVYVHWMRGSSIHPPQSLPTTPRVERSGAATTLETVLARTLNSSVGWSVDRSFGRSLPLPLNCHSCFVFPNS
jgi:hypothetical protein